MPSLIKRGKYYYIYYYDNQEKRNKGFSTRETDRAKARRKLKEFEARLTLQITPSNFVSPERLRIRISDALKLFLSTREISLKSVKAYHTAIKHLINAIDDIPVAHVTPRKYVEFLTYINERPLSRNSKANYTRHIFALFNWLAKQKIIDENPVTKIKPERKEPRPFDTQQLQLLFDFLKDYNRYYYDAVKLIYLVAYRIGEFTRAEWSDFDFDDEIIYVRNTKGNATIIPMLKDTREHLEQSVLPRKGKISVWSRPDSMRSFWRTVKAKTGLDFGVHALRKARGTDLANAGANPFFLQKYMRHEEIKITLQYYVKIDIAKAKAQLDSIL